MSDGSKKNTCSDGGVGGGGGGTDKPPTLSIDRAAFLILRVKKAFKKKRQQRKDRQAAQAAVTLAAQSNASGRRQPPPLLRSRTLPSIIVPGISILQNHLDPNRLAPGDGFSGLSFAARLSLQPKPRVSLCSDDSSLEYRRKSSGSPHYGSISSQNNNNYHNSNNNNLSKTSINSTDPYIYAFDEVERHTDGTVVLRIPAPHIVAARAYRMSETPCGLFAGFAAVAANSSNTPCQSVGNNTATTPTIGSTSSSSSYEKTPLYRLAKLLNQNTRNSCQSNAALKVDAPRRLSWERTAKNAFPLKIHAVHRR